jgi:ATP-dependent Lhr-like helicase
VVDPTGILHPAVAAWFRAEFPGGPTAAQRLAWPRIAAGAHVLLVSPTGTGKTLAAFLVGLDGILRRKLAGEREPALSVLYVSPLKALDNDIHRNLERPRAGIARALTTLEGGETAPSLTAAVRTGDTPAAARREQLRRPPDVLITTPESLYLLLTGAGRSLFTTVKTVILDEIHSVAGSKRGAHLALSLERLEDVVREAGGKAPQRVALSATVEPVESVAAFVGGAHPVEPLVVPSRKTLDLAVLSPKGEADRAEEASAWAPAVEAIVAEAATRRTTLVFCNNRRQAERVAAKLEEKLGESVPTHHGSVARAVREEVERDLKAGALRVLVATGSLELGLDVGEIDSVVQLGSPKGVARALQRVGRSGHLVGQTSRGRFIPLFFDDVLECAATVEAMRDGDVEETRPPQFPLDVLAQQIVAEVVGRGRDAPTSAGLLATFRRAAPYRALGKSLFSETLAMLSGKYPRERFGSLAPKLVWDRATDRVSALPAARLAALLDGGTIGDRGAYKAVLRDGKTLVGDLDEEFVHETKTGDVFLLGSRAWRTVDIHHDRVVVEDAAGAPARMPFWRGEGLGRTAKLAARVGRLKRTIAERLDEPELPDLLHARYGCDADAAASLVAGIRREASESPGVASDALVVFETFPNELGDPCVVVRSLFGRGVNLPWSLVLASVLSEETGVEAEAVATDDGILLRLPRAEREVPLERLARLTAAEARERLLAELPNSALFGARFRENAQRALLLPRVRSGRRTPFWLQRLRARDLLQTTRTFPDFPIVAETYRDCLRDVWEADRLFRLLDDLGSGAVGRAVDVRKLPSPASQSLLFNFVAAYMYEWDAPKAERGIHALAMNRELLGEVLGETLPDALRPAAADAARAEASRLVPQRLARSADELLLFFQELGDLTEEEIVERCSGEGKEWLGELAARGSVAEIFLEGEWRLVAAEDIPEFEAALGRVFEKRAASRRGEASSPGEPPSRALSDNLLRPFPLHGRDSGGAPPPSPLEQIVLRFFATRGPALASDFTARYGVPAPRVEETLEALRLDALVVRARFGAPDGTLRWAGARVAESVRRKTLGILRNEIRPVPLAAYRAFLASRQGVALGARFAGPNAAERAVGLLRGLPLPALAWESALLPARLAAPEPDALDVLSARGLLVWRAYGAKDPRAARLSFFFRGEGAILLPPGPARLDALSPAARDLYGKLAVAGASFLADLVARGEREKGEREIPRALVELVLAGLVTGDGIQGFREILLRKRGERVGQEALVVPRPSGGAARPTRTDLRNAERRVAARLSTAATSAAARLGGAGAAARPLHLPRNSSSLSSLPSGRWSLLDSPGVAGESLRADERAEAWARLLLARWGVVSRATLEREDAAAVCWADVAPVFARMEMRGDLRRGEFLERRGPVQYAEEETVEFLRRVDRSLGDEPALSVAGASDPVLEGVGAKDGWVALAHGEMLLSLDGAGALSIAGAASDRAVKSALAALQELLRRSRDPLGRPRRLTISSVNGRPPAGAPLAPVLEALGFSRDLGALVWRAL